MLSALDKRLLDDHPRQLAGLFGIPRYDLLPVVALAIQAGMVWSRLESLDELKAVCLFHAIVTYRPRPPASTPP